MVHLQFFEELAMPFRARATLAILAVGAASLVCTGQVQQAPVLDSRTASRQQGAALRYELTIERDPPFTLATWLAAVNDVPGVREGPDSVSATNPSTGEVITMKLGHGAAEVQVDGEWIPVFNFRGGSASFFAGAAIDNDQAPVRKAVAALARRLAAKITGEEGEEYTW